MGTAHAATRVVSAGGWHQRTGSINRQRAENPAVHEAPAGFSTQTGQHTAGKATATKGYFFFSFSSLEDSAAMKAS